MLLELSKADILNYVELIRDMTKKFNLPCKLYKGSTGVLSQILYERPYSTESYAHLASMGVRKTKLVTDIRYSLKQSNYHKQEKCYYEITEYRCAIYNDTNHSRILFFLFNQKGSLK